MPDPFSGFIPEEGADFAVPAEPERRGDVLHPAVFIHSRLDGFIDDVVEFIRFYQARGTANFVDEQKTAFGTRFSGFGKVPGDHERLDFTSIKTS